MLKSTLYFLSWLIVLVTPIASFASGGVEEGTQIIAPTDWKMVGEGRFKFAFWSIYDATLYSQTGRFDSIEFGTLKHPIRLKLTYLRDIDKDELVDNTLDQWLKQKLTIKQINQYKNNLLTTFPDVKENDHLAIEVGANGSQFYYNDAKIGPRMSTEFGVLFSGIWLSANTTEPDLRNKLIGSNKNEN